MIQTILPYLEGERAKIPRPSPTHFVDVVNSRGVVTVEKQIDRISARKKGFNAKENCKKFKTINVKVRFRRRPPTLRGGARAKESTPTYETGISFHNVRMTEGGKRRRMKRRVTMDPPKEVRLSWRRQNY